VTTISAANQPRPEKEYSSRFKGVSRRSDKKTNPWTAYARIDGKHRHLGYFATEEQAVAARRSAVAGAPRKSPRWMSGVGIFEDDQDWFLIELSQGTWAKVDVADMGLVVGYCWSLHGEGYAYRVDHRQGQALLMQREIMGLSAGDPRKVDHINHDRLDNRRSNLRIVTKSQDAQNTQKRKGCSSRFKGVSWDRQRLMWIASIQIDRKHRYLGRYEIEEDAARAYNRAAVTAWGDNAFLNEV
jgi:hypothetical protein